MTDKILSGAGGRGNRKGGAAQQQAFYTPTTAVDNLNSIAYANVIDILCEGEIQGLVDGESSIFLNNTPLYSNGQYNFKNVSVATRNGTQDQSFLPSLEATPITGTQGIYSEVSVGVTVEYGIPIVRTITDPSVKFVNVTITFPALQEQKSNGDIVGTLVQLSISLQGAGSASYQTRLVKQISGRTGDTYQVSYRVGLTDVAFPVNIKVTRDTINSTSSSLVNAFQWTSYTLVKTAQLRYPNTAFVALRVDAEQFNSIPARSYLIKGLKVRIPSNATVDPATGALIYDGVWNGTFGAAAYTTDPAWCLFDLLVSRRYGFGDYILTDADKANAGNFTAENLDKFAFYAASQYCSALNTREGTTNDYSTLGGRHGVRDGFGGYEPRFSLNVNIQSEVDAFQLINDMASVFRAMPFWSAGSVTVAQDAPASPSYLFNPTNVSEVGFSYSGSSQKSRSTVALVKYFDIARRDYLYEAVEDRDAISKYGVTQKNIEAFGCTSRGQARRLGEWLLTSENLETEVVTFTTSMDAGMVIRPGSVILIADPVRSGSRKGGRIKSATTTTIQIDDVTSISAFGSPRLSVIMPSGLVEERLVSNFSGDIITVSSPFSAAPQANAIWIYSTNSSKPTKWRVVSVVEQKGIEYEISALTYNESKYDSVERDIPLVFEDVSDLSVIPDSPIDFSASENIYVSNGSVRAQILVTWKAAEYAVRYRVRYRKDSGNWTTTNTSGPSFDLPDITSGLYEFSIASLGSNGVGSVNTLDGSINAIGKTEPPSNVTNFTASVDPVIGATLSWTGISDIDFSTYEIRRGSSSDSWDTSAVVTQVNATTYKLGFVDPGTFTYRIKAIDTIGVYSTSAASTVITTLPPNPVTSFRAFPTKAGDANLDWNAPASLTTFNIKGYKISHGDAYASSTYVTMVSDVFALFKLTWTGTRTFWVVTVDVSGAESSPVSVTMTSIASFAPPVVTGSFGGADYTVRWVANKANLVTPSQWHIRFGTSFASGTQAVPPVAGTATSAKITPTTTSGWYIGTKRIWVAAYYEATNEYGEAAYVDATIVKPPAPTLTVSPFSSLAITLTWTRVAGTLPLREHEIRYSEITTANPNPTWDSPTNTKLIKTSGTATNISVSSRKSYRFFVAAKDTAGNVGDPTGT
jgi:hypothetical protein